MKALGIDTFIATRVRVVVASTVINYRAGTLSYVSLPNQLSSPALYFSSKVRTTLYL
jgi:hypothetical protein